MPQTLPAGFHPFWFWNATLDADEIRWQIAQMAEQGVRGFFIHSRQGLGQPYLSEAFFDMVEAAIEAAEAHDMVVHLYDEYPYPSGVAGGEVILGNPQYHGTHLIQRTYDLDGGPVELALPRGDVLACVAVRLVDGQPDWSGEIDLRDHVGIVLAADSYNEMGLTDYNRKRYFASEPTPTLVADLPAGPHRLFVSVQAEITHHKYWDHFVDPLNAEAIRRFIALTHERYAARFGDKFGAVIRSIFVDETEPYWSTTLPAAFHAATGRELAPLLPALQAPDHPEHMAVAYALNEVRYQRFCETFEQPIAAWCRDHGVAYAGEKGSIRMAQLRYMDIPGCDPGHTKVGVRPDWLNVPLRRNAKATASAAYFYGKAGALCECYHSLGWSATLQDAKTIADGLLLAGIRYLVPHGFFYSTHGLVKHDAPPTFFFQMPYWEHFGALSKHVTRVSALFEGTYIDAELLVVDFSAGMPARDRLRDYMDAYQALLWALMRRHLDFHVVDVDILEEGEIGEGRVRVADITARVVVVPAMQMIEPTLRDWLTRFRDAGGVVVTVDLEDALDDVLDAVTAHVVPSLSLQTDGRESEQLVAVKRLPKGVTTERALTERALNERPLWFVLNLGAEPVDVTLCPAAGEGLHEIGIDPDALPRLRSEGGAYRRRVAPFEAFAVTAAPAAPLSPSLPVIPVKLDGPAEVRPRNVNLLRLGVWEMALQQPDGAFGPAAEVQPMPLAVQLTESGLPFAPAFRHSFGHVPEMALPELTVRYMADVHCVYEGAVTLVMEPGSLRGDWTITVNGGIPLTMADFAPVDAHVRGSLGVPVTDALRPGPNRLTVTVTTDQLDGGLRNVLYLAGDFGVALDPLGITERALSGHFEAYEANGLPFYAGVVDYGLTFELGAAPDAEAVFLALETDRPFHEAAEVAVNGGTARPILWEPRQIRVPTAELQVGENRLAVRVTTSLIRAFEGQWFDYAAHRYRDVGA